VEAGAADPRVSDDRGYPGSLVAAAALAAFFFPLISLIVALALYGSERNPVRKGALRTWAVASGAWLALQVVIGAILVAAVAGGGGVGSGSVDRTGPCVGGPEMGADGRDISGNGTKFVFPCSISGTATVSFPPSK
jgi:hypothetical protein